MARIVSSKLIADACPNCGHELSGVTAASLNGPFKRVGPARKVSIKGQASMCWYCGAMLVFADEEGHVRAMTAAERSAYRPSPIIQDLFALIRVKTKPPDFTKKSYN